MLFHDDRPCTIISKHTSILITHIWYWALVWTMCFFMMIDHVISPHPPFSIYRCVYIYVYTPIPNTQYIYIHIYVCIYPNTQYPIPNTKKGHQKIPFLLTSLHNSDLQSKLWPNMEICNTILTSNRLHSTLYYFVSCLCILSEQGVPVYLFLQ